MRCIECGLALTVDDQLPTIHEDCAQWVVIAAHRVSPELVTVSGPFESKEEAERYAAIVRDRWAALRSTQQQRVLVHHVRPIVPPFPDDLEEV